MRDSATGFRYRGGTRGEASVEQQLVEGQDAKWCFYLFRCHADPGDLEEVPKVEIFPD